MTLDAATLALKMGISVDEAEKYTRIPLTKKDWSETLTGMLKQSENNLAEVLTLIGRLVEPKVMLHRDSVLLTRIKRDIQKRGKFLDDMLAGQ